MKIMGASDEDLARARAAMAPADFELHEDNAWSFAVFQRMRTQWRTRGMDGEIYGLDYNVFDTVVQRIGVPFELQDQAFDDLHLMELETLAVVAERRRQQQ